MGGSRLSERLRTVVAARRDDGRARSAHCVDSRTGDARRQVRRDGLAAAGRGAQAIRRLRGVFGEGQADCAGAGDLDRGAGERVRRRKSHLLQLPLPAPEEHGAPQRQHGERDRHGDEHAERAQPDDVREHPRERHLAQPEAEEVQARRRPGVAGAVERRLRSTCRPRTAGTPGSRSTTRARRR